MAFGDKKNRLQTPFIPNSKIIFTLPLGGKILEGKVIVTGNLVISGETVPGTVYGEGGPINIIKRIIVTATPAPGSRYPGGKVVDCTPRSLLRYATMQHNGKFIGEQSGSTLGAGVNGTYPIYLSIPIFWADSTLRNSTGTALNTDPGTYSSVQVEIDTADLTYAFTGNNSTGGAATWAGLTVQWADDRVGLTGDTAVRFQEDHVFLIAATQARAFDQAIPQDGAFESWLIMAEQSAQATLSNSLLVRVQVDGTPISYDKYAQDIQQKMLDDEWIDPSQSFTGQYFIDWTDSVLQNTIQAGTLQTRFQVNNVSGANLDDLLIYTRRVFAPTPAS
jgi:hypothetical protein